MSKLRILHITPWFPNPENNVEAVFIAKHVVALSEYCQNEVLHLRFGEKKENVVKAAYQGIPIERKTFQPIINKWIIKEKLVSKFIFNYLSENADKFDIVNFYIAYPNAVDIRKFKDSFKQLKFVISEQWSAYHQEFNLPKESKGRKRIEQIFDLDIPLFAVSNALAEDIKKFTGIKDLPHKLIPNSVNKEDFKFKSKEKSATFRFCSINNWSTLKNPFVLLEAFNLLHKEQPHVRLTLCGSGQLDNEIKARISELNLNNEIDFQGRIQIGEVAKTLQNNDAYCQSSNYETFSAICIESLACGTPVVATNIGGMKDFINESNGILVDDMEAESWKNALLSMIQNYTSFDLKSISDDIIDKYNQKKIGAILFSHFQEVAGEG
ncbi:MAG: glycosyltransferase involved in cell wall biosynthesis [Arenicella sp.]|jgi:glycosyltransferase involved in cell wall biosynthesis